MIQDAVLNNHFTRSITEISSLDPFGNLSICALDFLKRKLFWISNIAFPHPKLFIINQKEYSFIEVFISDQKYDQKN